MADKEACLRGRLALRMKPVSSVSTGSIMRLRSIGSEDCATVVIALTAVNRVISLRSRSSRT